MRGAATADRANFRMIYISTHAPHARRGAHAEIGRLYYKNFYSRASCEARRISADRAVKVQNFYSRASCEARRLLPWCNLTVIYFYSRASCEARLDISQDAIDEIKISTHAPHARRGDKSISFTVKSWNFYSRASCEARRDMPGIKRQSVYFYSRASCEARRRIL